MRNKCMTNYLRLNVLLPDYAFERTVKPSRNNRRHRAAAQRERLPALL